MSPFVLNAVVKDCWNATGKYNTVTVRPAKVSKAGGSLHTTRIARRFIEPPKTTILEPFFQYYQIGDIEPYLFGVYNFVKDTWVSVEKLMMDNEVFINVFLDNGIMLTPKDCWLKKAGVDRNYILAVYVNPMFDYGTHSQSVLLQEDTGDSLLTYEDGSPIPISPDGGVDVNSLEQSRLLIRFYTNPSYNKGVGRLHNSKMVLYTANNPSTASAALTFLNSFPDNITTGWVLFNGMVSSLAYAKTNVAQLAQRETAVYVDKSIVKKLWFKLTTTPVHYLSEGAGYTLRLGTTGFYSLDNISLFVGTGSGSTFKGFYLDSSLEKYTYQISNTEIGISAYAIGLLRIETDFLDDLSNVYIYAVIRDNPQETVKSPGLNSGRLELLDGLSLTERNKIFNGDYPALNKWKIDDFRNTPFLQLMQSRVEDINDKLIVDGYGYSGVNRLFNTYPAYPESSTLSGFLLQRFRAGYAMRDKGFVDYSDFKIEALVYDKTGKLIRSQFFAHDAIGYVAFNDLPETKFAELTLTKGYSNELRYFHKRVGNLVLSPETKIFGYAVYVTPANHFGDWSLAAEGHHYTVVQVSGQDAIHWDNSVMAGENLLGRVVFGGDHYHYMTNSGLTKQGRDYQTLTILNDDDSHLGISPATIDIYLAGYLLHDGLDYVINGNKIYIFTPSVTGDPVRVRLCGLSPTGKRLPPIDVGFTDQGQIGLGSKCRQMMFKQCQFNIGGVIYSEDEINLGNSGQFNTDLGSGVAYSVKQRVAAIENYLDQSSVQSMAVENSDSQALYDGLQEQYPISEDRVITTVTDDLKHQVMSCFLNEILYQLKQGWKYSEIIHPYDKALVDTWITPFASILASDICLQSTYNPDFLLVSVHDKEVAVVSQKQLDFIKFCNANYLQNRVRIDGYFAIG